MDNRQYQIIKQYVGVKLLNYILNTVEQITYETNFDDFEFSEEQFSVLDDLSNKIQQCRIQFVVQGGYGDGVDFYLRALKVRDESLFNVYRKQCNGTFFLTNSGDKILDFLINIAVREYPNLLVTSSSGSPIHGHSINIGLTDYNKFIDLVKNDPLNSITNGKENLEYAFIFTTDDGLEFHTQVCGACSIIISRAFHNACNKINYSLEGVISEIEYNLTSLRKLADGVEIEYSSFVGIQGISFDGFDFIDFDIALLRKIDDISNPSPHTNKLAVQHTGEYGKYLSGNILEIKHKTKISKKTASCSRSMTRQVYQYQDQIVDALKFAIIFSTLEDKGLSTSFSENGFPLVQPGNYSMGDNRPRNYINITQDNTKDILKWFKHLSETDLNPIKVPMQRLKYAIFERHQAEDAIVDAIIAWEGIFSEAFETTFKVTGSISKYLSELKDREVFLIRLKKLYGLRSDIVHGKNSKLMEKENIEALRSEVIKIGLDCLIKLLKDDSLLILSPAERVKKLMIMA